MIYINGRFLSQKMAGIGRFSFEICKQLKKLDVNFAIIIPRWLEYENEEDFVIIRYGTLKSHLWEQINLRNFLKLRNNPFLLNLSGLGPLFYKRQIVTIHDLSFYANKEWFSKAYTLFYSWATPIVARNAMHIITVSQFSKTEIIKYLKIPDEKITIVYNAVSKVIDFVAKQRFDAAIERNIPEKYILAVSSIDPRKNLQRLIQAFQNLDLAGYKLVLVGGAANHFRIHLDANYENIIMTGFVSDNELSKLYAKCDFFVYPSLYEGFGIPPLEAMKNGCPIIVSNIPSLLEVCGEAAYYVDPYNVKDIENAIKELIGNCNLRKDLILKGIIRSQAFNWEESGLKVLDLIREVKK